MLPYSVGYNHESGIGFIVDHLAGRYILVFQLISRGLSVLALGHSHLTPQYMYCMMIDQKETQIESVVGGTWISSI